MAKGKEGLSAFQSVIVVLLMIGGAGAFLAWNFEQNEEFRPFKGLDDAALEDLAEAYDVKLEQVEGRYETMAGSRPELEEKPLFGERVNEFERIQKIADRARKAGHEVSYVMADQKKTSSGRPGSAPTRSNTSGTRRRASSGFPALAPGSRIPVLASHPSTPRAAGSDGVAESEIRRMAWALVIVSPHAWNPERKRLRRRPAAPEVPVEHQRPARDAREPGGAREFLRVAVQTPRDEFVEIQIRLANAYIVGFKGESSWYCLKGEKGGWGKPLSLGGNYNNLGHVGTVSYDDLGSLGDLSRHGKGVAIDKRLIAILIAITAESARFATVSTYFIGLTNSTSNPHLVGHTVDFESLKRTYFNHWANPPDEERVPGKVYHPVKSDILLPHA